MANTLLTGIISTYNQQFGFIDFYCGNLFFHKSNIKNRQKVKEGDIVSFELTPSKKKKNTFQATNIEIKNIIGIEKPFQINKKMKLGELLWHSKKGFGKIESDSEQFTEDNDGYYYKTKEFFFRDDQLKNKDTSMCQEESKCIFEPNYHNDKASNIYFIPETLYDVLKNSVFEKQLLIQSLITELKSYNNTTKTADFNSYIQIVKLLNDLKVNTKQLSDDIYTNQTDSLKFLLWYSNRTSQINYDIITRYISSKKYKQLIRKVEKNTDPNGILNQLFWQNNPEETKTELLNAYDVQLDSAHHFPLLSLINKSGYFTKDEKIEWNSNVYINSDKGNKPYIWIDFIQKEKNIFKRNKLIESTQKDLESLVSKAEDLKLIEELLCIMEELGIDIQQYTSTLFEKSNLETEIYFWTKGYLHITNLDAIYSYFNNIPDVTYSIKRSSQDVHQSHVLNKLLEETEHSTVVKKLSEIHSVSEEEKVRNNIKNLITRNTLLEDDEKIYFFVLIFINSDLQDQISIWRQLNQYSDSEIINVYSENLSSSIIENMNNIEDVTTETEYQDLTSLLSILKELNTDICPITKTLNEKLNEEYLFKLWYEDYTKEIDLEELASILFSNKYQHRNHFNSTKIQKKSIFNKAVESIETPILLNTLTSYIKENNVIDKSYNILSLIQDHEAIDNDLKNHFTLTLFQISDVKKQIQIWKDYLKECYSTSSIPLIEQAVKENIIHYKKYNIDYFQEIKTLLNILVDIKQDLTTIVSKLYNQLSNGNQFLLWFYGFTHQYNLETVIDVIKSNYCYRMNDTDISDHFRYINENNIQEKTFNLLVSQEDHLEILHKIFKENTCISSQNQDINIIDYIIESNEILEADKFTFANQIIERCDEGCKYSLWNSGYITTIDSSIIIKNLPNTVAQASELFYKLNNQCKFEQIYKLSLNNNISIKEIKDHSSFKEYIKSEDFKQIAESKNFREFFSFLRSYSPKMFYSMCTVDHITESFDSYNFVKQLKEFSRKKELVSTIENILEDLPADYQVRLWLSDICGELNYIVFASGFNELYDWEKKLFNKKVRQNFKDQQVKNFIAQIPKTEIIDSTTYSTTYKCKWRNIYYHNNFIQIFLSKEESTKKYPCEFAKQALNILTQNYFNKKRLDDIIVEVDSHKNILHITGLDSIQTKIIFEDIKKEHKKGNSPTLNAKEINLIVKNQSLKSLYLNFLSQQETPYKLILITEIVTERYGGFNTNDMSYIFRLPDNKGNLYYIWESAEFNKSKATHIFKGEETKDSEMLKKIKEYLQNTFHVRSSLHKKEGEIMEIKKELGYYCQINHDSQQFSIWEDRMIEALNFIKPLNQE